MLPSAASPSDIAQPKQWFSAWFLSSMFHLSAVVLMVALIDRAPPGASGTSDGEIGIVLNRVSVEGDTAAGGTSTVESAPIQTAPPQVELPPAAASALAPKEEAYETTDAPIAGNGDALPSTPRVAQVPGGGHGNYGPGEGQASVRVFGVEGRGTKFVYVFDRSTSMEGPPLSTAKQQLIQSLESLESVHQFHIIFFNQQLRHFDLSGGGRRIAFATDRNKSTAARFIGGITAAGGTDRFPALRAALGLHPDVIFFLTDADDPMSHSELDEIAELNRQAGVTICTIEFGRGPAKPGKNFLTELARTTSGQYGYVDTLHLSK